MSWLPQYHDFGLIAGSLSTAMQGYRSDLLSPFTFIKHPMAWMQAISRLHASHVVISPSPNFGYALCTRRCKPEHVASLQLSHWKAAFNGAEPIRRRTLLEFDAKFGVCGWDPANWACLYGLAETCVYGCGIAELPVVLKVPRARLGPGDEAMPLRPGDDDDDALVEFPGCYLNPPHESSQLFAISHPDSHASLPDGTVGEVRISGLSVALGYYRQPELTAETFRTPLGGGKALPDGGDQEQPASFLLTGDLGFIWEQRLFVVGRIKDILCIRGRTLHAHDVEACAEASHESLRPGCCAVFPVTPDDGDEALVVVAELKPEAATEPAALDVVVDEVLKAIRDGEGVKPFAVVLLRPRTILKTTSGKLRRRELRNAYAQLAAMAAAGGLGAGVAPGSAAAAPPGWGLLGRKKAEKEEAKPLIPADAVLRFWKDAAPSRTASQPPAARAAVPPPAPEGPRPGAHSSEPSPRASPGRASFGSLGSEALHTAETVLGYSACDAESPPDMAWAMRESYAVAWSLHLSSQEANTLSSRSSAAKSEPYGECPIEGLEMLLAGCNLRAKLEGAQAWCEAQGLDSVAELKKVGMEPDFVASLGLKPGKQKSLLIDIEEFR